MSTEIEHMGERFEADARDHDGGREFRARVSIEGVWTVENTSGALVLNEPGAMLQWARVNPNTPGLTVEDLPDPLPPEPGARFWGQRANDAQQYWVTVVGNSPSLDATGKPGVRVGYMPTDLRESAWDAVIWSDEVTAYGLVRLPDPEVTP